MREDVYWTYTPKVLEEMKREWREIIHRVMHGISMKVVVQKESTLREVIMHDAEEYEQTVREKGGRATYMKARKSYVAGGRRKFYHPRVCMSNTAMGTQRFSFYNHQNPLAKETLIPFGTGMRVLLLHLRPPHPSFFAMPSRHLIHN